MDGAVRAGMTALALCATGCVAGDRELEPDELDARDLLGLAPSVAAGWDADERAAARARLMDAWAEAWTEGGAISEEAAWPDPARRAADATSGLGAVNRRRAQSGQGPVIAGAGEIAARRIHVRIASPLELGLDDARDPEAPAMIDAVGWRADEAAVLSRGVAWAANLAAASGHPSGAPLRLHAVRQAPFGAVYLGEDVGMLVNPVLLASIEPAGTPPAVIQQTATASPPERDAPLRSAAGGNPYSFYGSVAECAAAQRLRCEACLPSSTCELTSRDAPDGNSECETLAGGDGAGYHLYCVNLSLAIATVAGCVNDEGPACPQDNGASNQLVRLEANRAFLDDATCGDALDSCLASIYGEPDDDFPSPPPDAGPTPDGGEPPPPPPPPPEPRDTEITCGDADCDFSPQCDSSCSSSCDDAFSCNADCNEGEDGCDGCDGDGGDDGDGSGGSGGGGCDSGGDDGGGDGSSGSSGCDSDSDCGGDCNGGDCGDCSGSDCGDCNSSGGSGGGSSNCSVARRDPSRPAVCRRGGNRDTLLALAWALMPIPYLERRRRRARRLASRKAAP